MAEPEGGPATPPRVFLDADLLIAGSASTSGASHVLLRLSELGVIHGITSAQASAEAERNIARKIPPALPAFRELIEAACAVVPVPPAAAVRPYGDQAHPKDAPILAAAVLAGCETLVTFNTRDFRPSGGLIVVEAPGAFLRRLRQVLATLAEHRSPPPPPGP